MTGNNTELYSPHTNFEREVDSETRDKILKARAKKAAAESVDMALAGTFIEVLIFILANETYAVETRYIKEVYPSKAITAIPCVPSFVRGVINIRRRIYSVVDLKYFLNLKSAEEEENSKVIILEDSKNTFGILTDNIVGVEAVNIEGLQTQLATLSDTGREFIKGTTKERLIILDGYKILNSNKLIVDEAVS